MSFCTSLLDFPLSMVSCKHHGDMNVKTRIYSEGLCAICSKQTV